MLSIFYGKYQQKILCTNVLAIYYEIQLYIVSYLVEMCKNTVKKNITLIRINVCTVKTDCSNMLLQNVY